MQHLLMDSEIISKKLLNVSFQFKGDKVNRRRQTDMGTQLIRNLSVRHQVFNIGTWELLKACFSAEPLLSFGRTHANVKLNSQSFSCCNTANFLPGSTVTSLKGESCNSDLQLSRPAWLPAEGQSRAIVLHFFIISYLYLTLQQGTWQQSIYSLGCWLGPLQFCVAFSKAMK